MKYTEENSIGLEVIHRDRSVSYKITGYINGTLQSISLVSQYNKSEVNSGWSKDIGINKVNEWLEDGTWIVIKHNNYYEIY